MSHVIFHMLYFTCHMSHVTCHMSHVTCNMSHVICHIHFVTFLLSHVTCHLSFHISFVTCDMFYVMSCHVHIISISSKRYQILSAQRMISNFIGPRQYQMVKLNPVFWNVAAVLACVLWPPTRKLPNRTVVTGQAAQEYQAQAMCWPGVTMQFPPVYCGHPLENCCDRPGCPRISSTGHVLENRPPPISG